jgi:7-cyano-7-deazaguanine synthase
VATGASTFWSAPGGFGYTPDVTSGRSLAIVLVSGGMDSCVTAAEARAAGHDLAFLHGNYGQRTEARELACFHAIADRMDVPRRLRMVVNLPHLGSVGGSSLTDRGIPVETSSLEPESLGAGRSAVPTSYVPFRNAHFLVAAVSWAESLRASAIYIGAVEEDSSGYPDCREAYFRAFEKVIELGTRPDTRIRIETPLIHLDKAAIVRRGLELGAPFELTWSCYTESDVACGVCDSCALRLRGFARARAADPIPYAART